MPLAAAPPRMHIPLHRRGAGVGCREPDDPPRRLRLLPLPRGDFHGSLRIHAHRMLQITTNDENYCPPLEGCCEKIGRASLLASHRPSKPLLHEARREPRPPDLRRFLIFSQLQGAGGGLSPTGRTPHGTWSNHAERSSW